MKKHEKIKGKIIKNGGKKKQTKIWKRKNNEKKIKRKETNKYSLENETNIHQEKNI
jgi:hypothetical protein